MLHALAESHSRRQVLWLHGARDGQHHPFAAEVRSLLPMLENARSFVCFSRPDPRDRPGQDFDGEGHLSQPLFEQLGVPKDAGVYLCGPNRFMAEMKEALVRTGIRPEQIHVEIFNGSESLTPGIVGAAVRPPHPLADDAGTGPRVSFARSGVTAHWNGSAFGSILELAEACDVPVRWSCRTGVCRDCESGLVSGQVSYGPQTLDSPAEGNVLACCSRPVDDVVVDL